MAKSTSYESKIPDSRGIIAYSDAENAVWRDLRLRQSKLLPGRVCGAFLNGLEMLDLPADRVPQLKDVNARLNEISGFGVEPVPALISPKRFFTLLAERKFPAATFIRRRKEFDYLQEPDVFHEIFGHCPMLTLPTYADFLQKYGEKALQLDKSYIWMMQRLFWFTVEFGLIRTEEGIRIYGAGIASSAGETPYAVESAEPERRPFDALTVFRTPYRIDIFQSVYYVIESAQQLYDLVTSDLVPIMDEAKRLGSLPPTFPPKEEAGAA
ncbi:phenylalanine 4-monooxygenase [Pelagibius sp.]|uniref:phenylalanine 4-monooxygenase n=1 Tax=Pelagibius sp. TaxID=1931238 RepID=UPI00260DB326|nr:phenylalanine 4-monooxygenase [Pelagibius sp.]